MKRWVLTAFLAVMPAAMVAARSEAPRVASIIPGPLAQEMATDVHARPMSAPAFRLPDLDDRPVDLAQLRGRVVMLYFWATW